MKLAIIQCECPHGTESLTRSLDLFEKNIQGAARLGADIALFPELFLGGYCNGSNFRDISQVVNESPILDKISKLCAGTNVGCVVGFVEKCPESNVLYNAAAVFGKDGTLLHVYRKCHLWSSYEKNLFSAGSDLGHVIDFYGTKVGILICYDVEFPESVRTLALQGASVILVPTALANRFNADITIPSRAFENHVFIGYANFVGAQENVIFCGRSVCCGPDGVDLWRGSADDSEICCVDLQMDSRNVLNHRARNPYMEDRRPDLYHRLSSK